ncbi:MAG: response regulator transcription factor [Hyphomicrobiaceae bacterium]|nr:response regulator transcription factor [Hyphomicrobiaceae bacterium]
MSMRHLCREYVSVMAAIADFSTNASDFGGNAFTAGETSSCHAMTGLPSSTVDVEARVAFIDRRPLVRECLSRALINATGWNVSTYGSAGAWLSVSDNVPVSLVVLCIGSRDCTQETDEDICLLDRLAERAPVAIMGDQESPTQIVAALDRSVRGYVPTSLPLHVAIEAMRLVRAGGIYVPASSLIEAQKTNVESASEKPKASSIFTQRQLAVIEALRKGKANKIIAYELSMRESTVKVHVRNIMKKLKARNRTEVAYLASAILDGIK